MSERHAKAGNQEHSLSHSFTHFLTHSFTLSRHAEQLLFSFLCSKVTVLGEDGNAFFYSITHHTCPIKLGEIHFHFLPMPQNP